MAESAADPALFWISGPVGVGVFHHRWLPCAVRLARTVRSERFEIAVNRDFDGVLDGCRRAAAGTLPDPRSACRIRSLYRKLYDYRPLATVSMLTRSASWLGLVSMVV